MGISIVSNASVVKDNRGRKFKLFQIFGMRIFDKMNLRNMRLTCPPIADPVVELESANA
jgi:hypothetical protein